MMQLKLSSWCLVQVLLVGTLCACTWSACKAARPVEDEDFEAVQKLFGVPWWNWNWDAYEQSRLRSLQQQTSTAPACGEVLDTWTVDQVKEELLTFLESTSTTGSASLLTDLIAHGVQVHKICAACSDYFSSFPQLETSNFCSPQDYGYNVTFSGLLIIPLQNDTTVAPLPGSRILNLYARGTRASSEPSTEWLGAGGNSSFEVLFNLLVTGVTGSVSLLPDYMGYGESLGKAYRAYIIRKGYQTSSVPLVYRVNELLQQEMTLNETRLSNGVVVAGYSEGGYAAVAIAEALASSYVGMDILRVDAGGAPLAISSTQLLRTQERVDNGTFPPENYYFFALLGSAYSSTYPDIANYLKGEDMLSQAYRNQTVQLVNSGSTSDALNNFIYGLEGDNPTELFNDTLMNLTGSAIAAGVADPCGDIINGEASFISNTSVGTKPEYFLCLALKQQDLSEAVLTSTYPINFCHSPEDVLVDYGNVPNLNLSNNSMLSLYEVSGTHVEAAGMCLQQLIFWFLGADFASLEAASKSTSFQAAVQTLQENATGVPSPSPSASPPTPSSTSSSHFSTPFDSILQYQGVWFMFSFLLFKLL